MKNLCKSFILMAALAFSGCATLTPELVRELAKDEASACFSTDVRGGVGSIVGPPTGGYGQATLRFCRSNKDRSTVTMGADGSISITNDD